MRQKSVIVIIAMLLGGCASGFQSNQPTLKTTELIPPTSKVGIVAAPGGNAWQNANVAAALTAYFKEKGRNVEITTDEKTSAFDYIIRTDLCVWSCPAASESLTNGLIAGVSTALTGGLLTLNKSSYTFVRTNVDIFKGGNKIGGGDYNRMASGIQARCDKMMIKNAEFVEKTIFAQQ